MNKTLYEEFKEILKAELLPALGCTEPGAVAYAAAQAEILLGGMPDSAELWCSGNIIKNVKGVAVPNSGGMRGIEAAAVLGILAAENTADCRSSHSDSLPSKNAENCGSLEVLSRVTEDDINRAKELLANNFCVCRLKEDTPNLYIKVCVKNKSHSAQVVIEDSHTNITTKLLDGKLISSAKTQNHGTDKTERLKDKLSVKEILKFADMMTEKDGRDIFSPQIEANTAIAEEGLAGDYGAKVGQTMLKRGDRSVKSRAIAKAAAGSDARMNGCIMPVVINSGSGNQGITVTVPVAEYAKEMGIEDIMLYRALSVSNLISIHIKHHIGKLSAFCGAVSAACGSGAAIAYLEGAGYSQICHTIANTLGNVGGIVCDGAKASCAAKIASSLQAAFLGYEMAKDGLCFRSGEGFVEEDIEDTIDNIGKIGKYGMKSTDREILRLMLDNKNHICG